MTEYPDENAHRVRRSSQPGFLEKKIKWESKKWTFTGVMNPMVRLKKVAHYFRVIFGPMISQENCADTFETLSCGFLNFNQLSFKQFSDLRAYKNTFFNLGINDPGKLISQVCEYSLRFIHRFNKVFFFQKSKLDVVQRRKGYFLSQ